MKPKIPTMSSCSVEENDDIISLLFFLDCDEVLQRIFLHLDPYSLKYSRQVGISIIYTLQTLSYLEGKNMLLTP